MRQRYYSQLAPPAVTGVRSLIDSASILWRWRLSVTDWDVAAATVGATPVFAGEAPPAPVASVIGALDPALLTRPQTPFVALHAAVALAAADRADDLRRLAKHLSTRRGDRLACRRGAGV